MTWQPIETFEKPKERSDESPAVLIWDGERCAVANFQYDSWWIDESYGYNEGGEIYHVTHWMPLPEPPKLP